MWQHKENLIDFCDSWWRYRMILLHILYWKKHHQIKTTSIGTANLTVDQYLDFPENPTQLVGQSAESGMSIMKTAYIHLIINESKLTRSKYVVSCLKDILVAVEVRCNVGGFSISESCYMCLLVYTVGILLMVNLHCQVQLNQSLYFL